MVEIKMTFATIDEAIAFMSKAQPAPGAADPKPEKAAKPPKSDAKPQAEPAASGAQTATDSAAASAASAQAETPEVEALTYEKSGIGEKISGYVGAKDVEGYASRRQQIVDLLAEFKVANGKLLKPEQFAPFLAKLDDLATATLG